MMRHHSCCTSSCWFFLLAVLSVLPGQLPAAVNTFSKVNGDSVQNITSAFNPHTASWEIAWPGRVAQYDLIYNSPPIDPLQGMALGNGEVGALLWCEDSRIIIALNKSDLWDDAAFGRFHNWHGDQEDKSTTLRHACRIIIDFKQPVFSTLYLTDFKGRLSLADASLHFHSSSPFGELTCTAFIDHVTGRLAIKLSSRFQEAVPIEVAMERYGSRTYSHWYSQINRDAAIGLSGAEAGVIGSTIYITQKLSSGTFAVAGAVVAHNDLVVLCRKEHNRRAVITLQGPESKTSEMIFSVTSPQQDSPLDSLCRSIDTARQSGVQTIFQAHAEQWKQIWLRSFMDYGDDYLNALWHLTQYYSISSQGGRYPGRFNNGLWTWDRDVQNWNFYFHWNQQQLCWPLNAAGHHELVDSYLNYRFRSLPQARKDAAEFFNSEGAFISDVTDRRGFNSRTELANHTPIAEIALDFWRQYRFTRNRKFLVEKAVPFITDAAKFYVSLLQKEEDGLYHAREGTGYEGWIKLHDSLTELVYGRALFATALAALQEANLEIPQAEQWRDIVDHCAPLPTVPAGDAALRPQGDHYVFVKGFYQGADSPTDEILAAGWGVKEKQWLTAYSPTEEATHNGLKLLDGIFPTVTASTVFPSNLVGLSQKGAHLFDVVSTTARLYSPEGTGWDPFPIVLARLGLRDELARDLERFPQRWQIYCNGWGHWGLEGEVNKDAEEFFRTNQVRAVGPSASKEKFPLPMWPFRHMSMESMSVLATAMNESVLQSHEGVLRIAPAFVRNRNGRFTLHAQDGFVVSFEIKSGLMQWISIKSLYAQPCRLQIPWEKATVHSNQAHSVRMVKQGDIVSFKTHVNEIFTLTPHNGPAPVWTVQPEAAAESRVRHHSSGKVKLGLERMY